MLCCVYFCVLVPAALRARPGDNLRFMGPTAFHYGPGSKSSGRHIAVQIAGEKHDRSEWNQLQHV